jgi:hypothetical protein
MLEEVEGAALALVDLETEGGPLVRAEEARACGDKHLDQVGNLPELEASLEGNQEQALVLASWPVGECVWLDSRKPGKARFVLCDRQEEKLWGNLEWSRISAGNDLTTMEAGLMEILNKIRLARRSASVDLPNFARVSCRGFPLHLSHG